MPIALDMSSQQFEIRRLEILVLETSGFEISGSAPGAPPITVHGRILAQSVGFRRAKGDHFAAVNAISEMDVWFCPDSVLSCVIQTRTY